MTDDRPGPVPGPRGGDSDFAPKTTGTTGTAGTALISKGFPGPHARGPQGDHGDRSRMSGPRGPHGRDAMGTGKTVQNQAGPHGPHGPHSNSGKVSASAGLRATLARVFGTEAEAPDLDAFEEREEAERGAAEEQGFASVIDFFEAARRRSRTTL